MGEETKQTDPMAAMVRMMMLMMGGMMLFMVLLVAGGGVGLYFALNRQPAPMPGPSPTSSMSSVIVGEHAQADSAVYESYFVALATLIESDTQLTQREQASRLIQMTGKAGRTFIKGQYPNLGPFMAQQFSPWEKAGELTAADRQMMAAKLKALAAELHKIHE